MMQRVNLASSYVKPRLVFRDPLAPISICGHVCIALYKTGELQLSLWLVLSRWLLPFVAV